MCRVHLQAQLGVLQPRYVLAFGVVAVNALLPNRELKLGEVRGRPIWARTVGGVWPVFWRDAIEIWPTYHPAAALRNGNYRMKITEDLSRFVEWRDNLEPYPFTCVVCKKDAEHWDDNGLAWCTRHGGRQLKLELVG